MEQMEYSCSATESDLQLPMQLMRNGDEQQRQVTFIDNGTLVTDPVIIASMMTQIQSHTEDIGVCDNSLTDMLV